MFVLLTRIMSVSWQQVSLQQPQLMGFRRASARAVDDKRKVSEKLNGDFLSMFDILKTSRRIQRKLFETLPQNVVSTAHEQEMLERRVFFANLFWSPPLFHMVDWIRKGLLFRHCTSHRTMRGPFFRLDERGTENNFLAIPFYLRQ